jgi:tetratricopeptide (TPR) repeat protein
VAAIAYSNSFDGVFVLDDEPAIVENTHIRRLWPLTSAMQAPHGTTLAGRPFVSLTFALNYALAPADARNVLRLPSDASPLQYEQLRRNLWGYHALNLLVHIAAAVTLFGIARRTLLVFPSDGAMRRHATTVALCTAALWAVHPLTTAAVSYVIQRSESLMGLCFLLTLYCSIRAWTGAVWWTAVAVTACVAGMASKESMVAAPLVVVMWDAVFSDGRGSWPSLLRRRWTLYVALAATWGVLAVLVAGGHRPDAVGFAFPEWPWWRYLATQAGVIAHYLRLIAFPSPLVLDYEWPPAPISSVAVPALLTAGSVITSAVMFWKGHPIGFAGLAFFLVLAPTSSVLPIVTEVAAEHRMYLPMAVAIATAVTGAFALLKHLRFPLGWGLALACVLLMILSSLTQARNRDYQSLEAIWRDTVVKRPGNVRARHNYATTLLAQGRFREAEEHLRLALQLQPRHADVQGALGSALCAQGRLDEGIAYLQSALALAPRFRAAEQSLGEAYASRGQMDLAVEHYSRALDVRGDDAMLLNRVGWILATDPHEETRDGRRALALATQAAVLTGRADVTSLDTLAAAQAELEQFQDAAVTAAEALALARAQGARDYEPELEQRLLLYREKRPFRSRRP